MAKTSEDIRDEMIHGLALALMVDPSQPERDTLRAAIRRANDHERLISDVSASAGMDDYGPVQDTIDAVRALRAERDELRDTVAYMANGYRVTINRLRRIVARLDRDHAQNVDEQELLGWVDGVVDELIGCGAIVGVTPQHEGAPFRVQDAVQRMRAARDEALADLDYICAAVRSTTGKHPF